MYNGISLWYQCFERSLGDSNAQRAEIQGSYLPWFLDKETDHKWKNQSQTWSSPYLIQGSLCDTSHWCLGFACFHVRMRAHLGQQLGMTLACQYHKEYGGNEAFQELGEPGAYEVPAQGQRKLPEVLSTWRSQEDSHWHHGLYQQNQSPVYSNCVPPPSRLVSKRSLGVGVLVRHWAPSWTLLHSQLPLPSKWGIWICPRSWWEEAIL